MIRLMGTILHQLAWFQTLGSSIMFKAYLAYLHVPEVILPSRGDPLSRLNAYRPLRGAQVEVDTECK